MLVPVEYKIPRSMTVIREQQNHFLNTKCYSSFIPKGKYETNFIESSLIGSGSFGEVYKVIEKLTKKAFAVKKITYKDDDDSIRELSVSFLIGDLESELIVKYYDVWYEVEYDANQTKISNMFIQMELCEKTLEGIIEEVKYDPNLNFNGLLTSIGYFITSEIFIEILEAIDFLHHMSLIHRDINPNNILLNYNPNSRKFIKIADFGLSKVYDSGRLNTQDRGNLRYAAPEVLNGRDYDLKADIYSLGNVLHDLFQINFGRSYKDIGNDSSILLLKYQQLINYYRNMTSNIPSDRPECKELLDNKHLWALNNNDLNIDEQEEYLKQILDKSANDKSLLYSMIITKLSEASGLKS